MNGGDGSGSELRFALEYGAVVGQVFPQKGRDLQSVGAAGHAEAAVHAIVDLFHPEFASCPKKKSKELQGKALLFLLL